MIDARDKVIQERDEEITDLKKCKLKLEELLAAAKKPKAKRIPRPKRGYKSRPQ